MTGRSSAGRVLPDRVWKHRGKRRGVQPQLPVGKIRGAIAPPSTVIPTHFSPSQVIPFPLVLDGEEFTGSVERMQKAPALDYSTRRSIERYKGAGYQCTPLAQCANLSAV